MAYKSEREWKDLDKASKVVMALFLVAFLGIGYGLAQASNQHKVQQNILKTQMVHPGR